MLFHEGDAAHPIVIVDWQTAGVGNGATDIAYYLGTALTPERRRTHERALVHLWIDQLVKAGVPEADTQSLWDTYRRDALAGFLMGVLASMIVAQTPRGDAMFLAMCARAAAMVEDHGSVGLI
jgi:thiamine kinase-like enzyme